MNTTTAKDYFLTYWKYLAIVVLLLILVLQCNSNNQELSNAKSNEKKAKDLVEQANTNVQHAIAEADVRELKYKDTIAFLDKQNQKHVSDILDLSKQSKIRNINIQKYTTSEISQFFSNRYKGVVPQIDKGIVLNDTISKNVIIDVTAYDSCKERVFDLNGIIYNDSLIFKQKDNLYKSEQDKNKMFLKSISEFNTADSLNKTAIKDITKAYKRERNKKNLWKLGTVGAVAVILKMLLIK